MNRLVYALVVMVLTGIVPCAYGEDLMHAIAWSDDGSQGVLTVHVPLETDDALYKEYVHFASDHDGLIVGHYSANVSAITVYDPTFKENKSAYVSSVTFTVPLQ